jgi:hypothetical protein
MGTMLAAQSTGIAASEDDVRIDFPVQASDVASVERALRRGRGGRRAAGAAARRLARGYSRGGERRGHWRSDRPRRQDTSTPDAALTPLFGECPQ